MVTQVQICVEAVVIGVQVALQQGGQLSCICWQLLVDTLFSSSVWPQEVAKCNALLLEPLLYDTYSAMPSCKPLLPVSVLLRVSSPTHWLDL